MIASVNKIIPFSSVDGPGNRIAIFFQSCPFKCLYCHNPETINHCCHCGKCVDHCPNHALTIENQKVIYHRDLCCDCDTCLKTCEHLASPKIRMMSVDMVVEEIQKVKPFIRGITTSGGECMNHAGFLEALFKEVKPLGLTCLIDSNGFYDFKEYPALLDLCDGVMLDVKATNPEFHQEIIHGSNETVLKNLTYLLEMNKLTEVRTVILPHQQAHNLETVDYVSKQIKDQVPYKLLKYRYFGVRKDGVDFFKDQMVPQAFVDACLALARNNGCSQVKEI